MAINRVAPNNVGAAGLKYAADHLDSKGQISLVGNGRHPNGEV